MIPTIDLDLLRPTATSLPITLLLLVVLAAVAIAPSALVELSRLSWTHRRRDLALALALFAAALALRLTLGSHSLIHENHHGYRYLAWTPGLNALAEAHGVPSAHLLLVRLAGGGDHGAFVLGAVLSSVAVVGLTAYTSLVTRSVTAGYTAGALLALQPLAIAMATTEEFLVSASGLGLAGIALLHVGAAQRLRATLALGALSLSLAAASREITLPLAALAVPALLSARTSDGRVAWRATVGVVAAMTALLIVQAARIVSAWRALPATPGYMGAPNLPWLSDLHRNPGWVGWMEPYIPRWEGWCMALSLVALAVGCVRRRDVRLALGVGVVPLIALAQGGLVRTGWFPTGLRHQLLSMAALLIPVGWLVATLAKRLPTRLRLVAPWAVVALAAVSLWRRPDGYRIATPHVQEYRFFHDALRALPERGAVVYLPDDPLPHVGGTWVTAQHPRWRFIRASMLPRVASSTVAGPVYLLLDRVCFVNPLCITPGPRGCGDASALTLTESRVTPFGRMIPACADALDALPWRTVASRVIRRSTNPSHDIPSFDPSVTIAVLRWDRP